VRALVALLELAGLAPRLGFNAGSGALTTVLSLSLRPEAEAEAAPQPPRLPLLWAMLALHPQQEALEADWAPLHCQVGAYGSAERRRGEGRRVGHVSPGR
jgi:hypothetical protein